MKELSDSMCPNMVCILFSFIPNQRGSKKKKAHLVILVMGGADSRTLSNSQASQGSNFEL